MSHDTLAALRAWADAHADVGYVQAVQVRELLAEYDSTRAALASAVQTSEQLADLLRTRDELIRVLTERVCVQAEILSRKAEVSRE